MPRRNPLGESSLTTEFLSRPFTFHVHADGMQLNFDQTAAGEYRSGDFTLRLKERPISDRAALIDLELSRPGASFKLEAFRISVALPAVEIHRFKIARTGFQCGQMSRSSYVWWLHEFASANKGVPFLMAYSRTGINKGFFGYINQLPDTNMRHDTTHHLPGPDEKTIQLVWIPLQRPVQGQTVTTDLYKDTLYLSLEPTNYYSAIRDYANLVERETSFTPPSVPEACTEPVWCSWYAFRMGYDHDSIVENARLASGLGMKNLIMDANVRMPVGEWIYKNAGKTADAVRKFGLRPILWLSPYALYPQMKEYAHFRHLKAIAADGKECRHVCPMAEGAPQFLADRLRSLMLNHRLDGLKLDFLDEPDTWNCTAADHNHAYQTLGEGTDACMAAMHKAITSVKADAIIEFRQNYANINNRKYGNCFRGNDAPYDFDHIRRETFTLWPYSKGIPVHADYAYWHPAEPLSNKAIFMACIMYGCVPTISMDLRKFTQDESRLVRAWLDFYSQEKETLLWGRLIPMSFDPHFSVSRIESDTKTIFGLFSEIPPAYLDLSNAPSEVILINGTNADRLLTAITNLTGDFACRVLDPFHRTIEEFDLRSDGELRIDRTVPIGGLVRLRRA